MPATQVRGAQMQSGTVLGAQIGDGSVQRNDLDATTVGSAVIRKAIQGSGIILISTGGDAGTGDVTIGLVNLPLVALVSAITQTATAAAAHMTYTVPAGSAQVGTVYHIHAYGDANNGTTAITFTGNIWWGGTGGVALLTPGFNSTTTSATGRLWILDADVIIRTTGATASVSGDATLIETTSDATGLRTTRLQVLQPPGTIDTTIAKDLVFGWTLSATTGAPQVRTLGGYIHMVK